MENGGRSGGGRGKGKKGKKKAVNSYLVGKKGNANVQGHAVGSKPVIFTPLDAREDDLKTTRGTKDQTLTKRKRLKKATEAMDTMWRKQVETETLMASGQAHEQLRTKSSSTAATVKSQVMSLTGKKKKKKKKRKRNVVLNTLNGTSDSGRVTTTGSMKEGPPLDEEKLPVITAQSIQKKVVVLSPSPSTATVTNQKMVVATSPKREIAQTQHAEKSDLVTTAAMASPRKMAKKMKTKAVGLSAGSMSMLPKDKSEVIMNKLEPKTKALHATDVANVAKGTLMLQQVLQADAAITAKSQDEVTTVLCTNVTTRKKTIVDTDSSPSAAAFDDEPASRRPAPDASTRDPAISSKPSHTVSAAANLSSVREKRLLQELMPGEATSHSTDITKASPALVANDFLPQQLATARLVSPPPAKSKVTGGHKRRRSIDEADPLQPPTKRSAALSTDAVDQSQANRQSSTGGEFATLDQLPNLPSHHGISPPATVQDTHECSIKVVGGQVTPTVEVNRSLSQSASGKHPKTEPVNLCRTTAQPTQLLESITSLEPAPEQNTAIVQAQAAVGSDTQPLAKQVEPAVKAKGAISAATLSKLDGFGPRSIAAKTQEVDIVMDRRKSVQEMMNFDLETSSHDDSRLTQPVQSMVSLPSRPRNAWGASFGMVLPAHGAFSVPRTLSTTPLSSWFLSRGYANFVKQVHFSDDDDDASSSEDDVPLTQRPLSNLNEADKVPLKSRASTTKKNAFLESLTTQSYWRSWYGTVDMHNLLDPPLVYVPDKLQTHEVTPLSLPAPRTESDSNTPAKKMTDLESLEADIRQEKQRSSAFSKQLLMMLQGKTVSGKSLDEEYRLLLHQ